MPYPGLSFVGSYPSAEIQSMYSPAPADCAVKFLIGKAKTSYKFFNLSDKFNRPVKENLQRKQINYIYRMSEMF